MSQQHAEVSRDTPPEYTRVECDACGRRLKSAGTRRLSTLCRHNLVERTGLKSAGTRRLSTLQLVESLDRNRLKSAGTRRLSTLKLLFDLYCIR